MRNNPSANTPSTTSLQTSSSPSGTADKKVEPGGRSIEFNQAPVEMVFKVYGELKGVTVLKDPQTPAATITLQPLQGQELTDEDKIEAIETVLEMNGIHLEPYGEKFCRAIPRKDVRKDGIPLIMDPDAELRESTRVVSLVVPFRNISVEEAQKALEGFKSANGVLLVFERTNSIIITDTEANINRMREIARMIDITTPVTENVYVRQIHNAAAADIKTALEAIVQKSKEELEKDGKQPKTAAQSSAPRSPFASRLMNRNNPQPTAPVNQPSIVTSVSDADRGMIRGKVLILSDERSNKLIIVTSKSNMDFFDKVIEQLDIETTPPTVVKVYRLKYADAEDVSEMINDLIGNAPSGKSTTKSSQNAAAKTSTGGGANMTTGSASRPSTNKRTGEPQAGELSKENTTVLADKRINGLVVMTQKELVPTVEAIIEAMDIKLAQVLIETVIIEVSLDNGIESGIDWVQKGRKHGVHTSEPLTDALGRQLFYPYAKDSEGAYTKYVDYAGTPVLKGVEGASETPALKSLSVVARDGFLNYVSGGAYGMGGGASGGAEAFKVVDFARNAATNLLSKSFSFVFDSDELGISAILHMTENDNRAKYIASPVIMTVDNKEASIDATENRQFLTGWTAQSGSYGNSGQPTPNYSAKDIGIKLKITPKINPNGTVMLNVEEEYSRFVENGQSMLIPQGGMYIPGFVDLAVERKMSADVLLEDKQTVVFSGLTETAKAASESGIPILKDIPWIGKWLFSEVKESEGRKELLVFLTPYVLDDAEAAQVEALRRKKTLSDPNPWDDHGWSLSELADPVEKKEQLRRLKDEWKKQDEERKTKIAIEKAKVERVKALEKMSRDERELWLKMHKEELDEEKREELEEKMLDEKSQEELKKIAAEVRERKLREAEKEIGAAEEAYRGENERAKKDREDAEKAEK
ncbi:MAG: hypothetical protein IKA69_03450 [Kiritimatiellae bacterium]|nr:hypothetical protein [Kiritimatiellia bacterium]